MYMYLIQDNKTMASDIKVNAIDLKQLSLIKDNKRKNKDNAKNETRRPSVYRRIHVS